MRIHIPFQLLGRHATPCCDCEAKRKMNHSESIVLSQASGNSDAHSRKYVPLLSDPLLKLYRYEDVILKKRRLLESISAHFLVGPS